MNSSYPFSLSEMARIEYESVMVEERYSAGRRDYGTGDLLTHAEVHALAEVGAEPGITVLALAARTCRTKGAMSQLLAKLEAKGLLERRAARQKCFAFSYAARPCRDAGARRLRLAGTGKGPAHAGNAIFTTGDCQLLPCAAGQNGVDAHPAFPITLAVLRVQKRFQTPQGGMAF